jgi:hypothetical protein
MDLPAILEVICEYKYIDIREILVFQQCNKSIYSRLSKLFEQRYRAIKPETWPREFDNLSKYKKACMVIESNQLFLTEKPLTAYLSDKSWLEGLTFNHGERIFSGAEEISQLMIHLQGKKSWETFIKDLDMDDDPIRLNSIQLILLSNILSSRPMSYLSLKAKIESIFIKVDLCLNRLEFNTFYFKWAHFW